MSDNLLPFHALFQQLDGGAVAPRVAVLLRGVHLAAGLRLPAGCAINNVEIEDLQQCLLAVRVQNDLHIIDDFHWNE